MMDQPTDAFEAMDLGSSWGFDTWNWPAAGLALLIVELFAVGLYVAWREEKQHQARR